MNRVRYGLTGLALMFLVALLAAALFAPLGGSEPTGENDETLATLGVTPKADEPPPASNQPPLATEPLVPDTMPLPPLGKNPADEPLMIPEEDLTKI